MNVIEFRICQIFKREKELMEKKTTTNVTFKCFDTDINIRMCAQNR